MRKNLSVKNNMADSWKGRRRDRHALIGFQHVNTFVDAKNMNFPVFFQPKPLKYSFQQKHN